MQNPFFTIGHSTRTIPEFIDLLRPEEIGLVVDVRTIPRSRTNPQFNHDVLPETLARYQIGYEHVPELGGLRGSQPMSAASPNDFWENQSFRNYADYALTAGFRRGFDHLRKRGAERRCVIMCAEAVWWRCHRRIIADYLLAAGELVFHVMAEGRVEAASITRGARAAPDGGIVYPTTEIPRETRSSLDGV